MLLRDRLRLWRRLAKAAVGRDVAHRAEIAIPSQRFGTEYGGWTVSLEGLQASSVVYSFGVGEDVSFDLELIAALGVDVHAFDPTPVAVNWIASKELPARFRFYPVGIADYDGTAIFNSPINAEHASYTLVQDEGEPSHSVSAEVRRLSSIMADLQHQHIDLLKLDIEGAEYAVIENILNEQVEIGQLLVEFHHGMRSVGIERTKRAVQSLRENGFVLFDVSPRGEEYSFINRNQLRRIV